MYIFSQCIEASGHASAECTREFSSFPCSKGSNVLGKCKQGDRRLLRAADGKTALFTLSCIAKQVPRTPRASIKAIIINVHIYSGRGRCSNK
jgi:hypothetical protein